MIYVEQLYFSYTKRPFIENINFHVGKGEIFGFLGPSGAGKSTLQKILTGVLREYEGTARAAGIMCKEADSFFYERIGVDFEYPTLYEKLTARENLQFFSSLYKKRAGNPEEYLGMVGLENYADERIANFSKGMKSRVNFIKSLIHDPDILFLDEPTSGLDPSNSQTMKNIIKDQRSKGKTIILTTHNMEDAEELCDQVAFIADGKIKAMDSPHNLIMARGAAKINYTYFDQREKFGECLLKNSGTDEVLQRAIRENKLLSIHSSEPNLNDIFIEVTGRTLV